MGRQSRLVVLLLLSLGVILHQNVLASTPHSLIHDDILDNELHSIEITNDLLPEHTNSGIKISTPKLKEVPILPLKKDAKQLPSTAAPTTYKPVSDEILNDLIEASKHSAALADDPQFNKMLPDKLKKSDNTKTTKQSDENYEYDYYYGGDDDDYNYNYDESTNEPDSNKKSKSVTSKPTVKTDSKKEIEMKPIKEDKKTTSDKKNKHDKKKDKTPETDDIIEDDYNDEDDDDDDNLDDDEDLLFNENVPCPRYCVCARNINSYLVATCSRFDPGTQKFGSDITDLIVSDVGPKYPILLGPKFFVQMGLKHISSIKISNCTIEYLDPEAFHGLDELYSVNLTNVGLNIINPDTFSKNKKLRMLTISGNDLNVMSTVSYLLKSDSIEELDLSRNNLLSLNPNAFEKLSNIVYINLSKNEIEKIPHKVFDNLETLEELDLSYNLLKALPPPIFNHTSLSILHMQGNALVDDLSFGTEQLQQLDLSYNNIVKVHHGMFDKMTGLTNLNLKGNGILKIQPDSFLTLKNLRHIDLSVNDLNQISRMMFYKNSELDVIRLNDNPQLSQLPTDGFLSVNGFFTVYYLDISNCAIGALGHKTFSTLPHLSTLKLAWNNINYLERDTFAYLKKLIDLDLSNNLIAKLDELTFMYNNDLTKLNLAGNPLAHLSVRLFLPMNKLRELDVSECELTELLSDNYYGIGNKYKFYETLRSFNASSNHIKKISTADIKKFTKMRTLDISHNPIECNLDFHDFITYVLFNTHMGISKEPTSANIESATTFTEPHAGWAELAREVCKHSNNMKVPIKTEIKKTDNTEKLIELVEHELDADSKRLLNIGEKSEERKMINILNDPHKTVIVKDDHLTDNLDEDLNEEDLNSAKEVKDDDDDDNDSVYEDEDEDDDDDDDDDDDKDNDNNDNNNNNNNVVDNDAKKKLTKEKLNIKSNFDFEAEINNFKNMQEQMQDDEKKLQWVKDANKAMEEIQENWNNDDDEVVYTSGRIYFPSGEAATYIIIIGAMLFGIILMGLIAKCVVMVMYKRGERYRMAILASQKNSIVYQKLSEDIKPKELKLPKHPKVHRYSPINQV